MKFKIWSATLALVVVVSSCGEFLDINDNPNSPTTADVQLVLPQAIVASASIANQFNSYGGHFGGFIANAGGFSGFGTLLNYNLAPGDYNNMWVNTYTGPLQDFKYVIDQTAGDPNMAFYNAAAKIMSVVNFQRLVDAYGDVPFTQALRGEEGVNAPSYDDAATIYQSLIATLDEAIAQIDNNPLALGLTASADPLFGKLLLVSGAEQMLAWKRYANTLKLRMLVRTNNTAGLASIATTFGGQSAFLVDDVIVNPGYELNRPNPAWATWGRTIAGALANSSRIPTTFSFAFYSGTKILDQGRGATIYVNYPATPNNQLGNEDGAPTIVTGQVTWASNASGLAGTGVLKGPAMGQPLMLLAESKFLLAEAQLRGNIAGDYVATFYEGISASFRYLYKNESGNVIGSANLTTLLNNYKTANAANKLVEIEAATNLPERLEAIITQKYIAMNMITSDEAWNEYRRTGFPITIPGGAPARDIASNKSSITTRTDRLPTRVMYPSSEQSLNASNYRNVDYTSERIFWDPN
ncbi:MAG: SusD/RagB family nutrient-binding outer membrane lipoprotein [Cyclobacteriaceae bacterium]|nr:SusD/RagB family nutrient-binding outer membrane lipoprotein [Cyclobacteriaceae bacterium]